MGLNRRSVLAAYSGAAFTPPFLDGRELREPGNVLDVRWFGAKGDGRADDTDALRGAFAVLGEASALVFPPGVYRIRGPLVLPGDLASVEILGVGRVVLLQELDNSPIIILAEQNVRRLTIRGFSFRWARDQGPDRVQSIAIAASTVQGRNDGIWNCSFEHLSFSNGYRGISILPEASERKVGFWGCRFVRLSAGARQSGAIIGFTSSGETAWPNNYFESIYVRGDSLEEEAIILSRQTGCTLTNIEFNFSRRTAVRFLESRLVDIRGIRVESGRLGEDDVGFLSFTDTDAVVEALEIQTPELNDRTGSAIAIGGRSSISLGARSFMPRPGINVSLNWVAVLSGSDVHLEASTVHVRDAAQLVVLQQGSSPTGFRLATAAVRHSFVLVPVAAKEEPAPQMQSASLTWNEAPSRLYYAFIPGWSWTGAPDVAELAVFVDGAAAVRSPLQSVRGGAYVMLTSRDEVPLTEGAEISVALFCGTDIRSAANGPLNVHVYAQ